MNSYFILSLVSLLCAVVIIALKVCYASKCDNISFCWGCIHIEREVELEKKEINDPNEMELDMKPFKQKSILKNNLQVDRHSRSENV